jgi:hypothetical protein
VRKAAHNKFDLHLNKTKETGGERKDAQTRVHIDDLSAEP